MFECLPPSVESSACVVAVLCLSGTQIRSSPRLRQSPRGAAFGEAWLSPLATDLSNRSSCEALGFREPPPQPELDLAGGALIDSWLWGRGERVEVRIEALDLRL